MLAEDLLHGLGEIAQKMKPIGDLRRRGGSLTRSICIGGRAVACDHLDPRVVLEPLRQRGTLAVWEERDRLVAFQVHKDSAIRAAFPERPIIHAQDAGRRQVRLWLPAQQAEERVPADPQAPRVAQANPRCPAQRHAEGTEALGEPQRAPGPGGRHGGQAFGEDAAVTGAVTAKPPADAQLEAHAVVGPRQVGQRAVVAAVDTSGYGRAEWTGHAGLRRSHPQSDLRRGSIDMPSVDGQR
jgi:hypothetical protein